MRELLGNFRDSTHLRFRRIHRFRAKIGLYIEFGPYVMKTAETQGELLESFRLRHEVFNQEFRGQKAGGLDIDGYDKDFDHLIIVDRESSTIVGTYRVNCSADLTSSYTATEFDLSEVCRGPGPFLELGRACIRKNFRKGAVISLLWRGIAEYMNLADAKVLLGCSSLKITDPLEAALVYRNLVAQGTVLPASLSGPTKKYRMKGFDAALATLPTVLSPAEQERADELTPSLLKSYLKFGAKVAAPPAFDGDFNCIDLLTILRKEDLPESVVKRFQVAR